MQDVTNDLTTLFEEAKTHNEFEFVWTLLNYKSIGSPEIQANLHEWLEALTSYKSTYLTSSAKEKTRMAALFYSTFFENSDFYNIIGNLCRIKLDMVSSSFLFWKTKKYERLLGIGEKEKFLTELLFDTEKMHIVAFFEDNHYSEIRNSFFHSAYSLNATDYILHDGEITINKITQRSFDINTFFYPMVERVMQFFEAFRDLYLKHWASYQQNKVLGRNRLGASAIVIGTARGLGGIRIPNSVNFFGKSHDSGIWVHPQFNIWAGHNMVLDFPSIEQIELREQLSRYSKKTKIRKDDQAFINMVDKIVERNDKFEMTELVKLCVALGGTKNTEMENETNPYKKKFLITETLQLYRKALELNNSLIDLSEVEGKIIKLEAIPSE